MGEGSEHTIPQPIVPRDPNPGAPALTGTSNAGPHEGQILPFCVDVLFTSCITVAPNPNQNSGTPQSEGSPEVSMQPQDPLSVVVEPRDDLPTGTQPEILVRMFNRLVLNFFSSALFQRFRRIHCPGVPA